MWALFSYLFVFKQKTAYEMRISDWSSDVCSSDLTASDWASARACWKRLVSLSMRMVFVSPVWNGVMLWKCGRRRHFQAHRACRRGPDARRCKEIGRASGRERVCQYV